MTDDATTSDGDLAPYINHQKFSTEGNPLTVGQAIAILKEFPADMNLYFNVEERNGDNWDTTNVGVMAEKWLCPGYTGCTHTQPEMDYELVFFIEPKTPRKKESDD